MPAIAKIPETEEEYKSIVLYLQSNILPLKAKESPQKKSNFVRRCKQFEVDEEILYIRPTNKNGRRRVLPKYDTKLRDLVLNRFHDQANHREYHKTYSAIVEKHIGITQEEVREYVNKCSVCAINTSIKERTDMTPVVSTEPWAHLQIDLIDFHEFADVNDGYSWLLTCVCVFSKFLVAVPMKNKEAATVAKHLINDVFKIPGPPRVLQSDNGKEFVAEIVKNVCNVLNITIKHGRPRHPQSQGQIERLNQTIGRGFTKLLWDNNNQLQRKDWINIIDAFVTTYNSTVHRAHACTPHQALFGWKMHCIYDSPDTVDDDNGIDNDINNGNNDNGEDDNNNENGNENDDDNNQIDDVTESTVNQHLERVLQTRQSLNDVLEKYRSKVCQKGSVHRKKRANNTIEAGTPVFIAPDHDNNTRTRKRKLQPTYSETGTFKRLKSNNKTAVIEVDNKEISVPVMRIKPRRT